MFDKFHEECGVVGVYGHPEAANMVYLCLYALQHRGQESSGIVSSDGEVLISHRQMGLVADVFKEDVIKRREGLETSGSIFQSTSDTEVIIHLIATSKEGSLMGRIVEALSRVRGAYSLLFLTVDRMIAARDPMGFRPLVLGRFKGNGSGRGYVVASETCALDLIE